MPEKAYIEAAKKYRPNKIKTLFVAESPPAFKIGTYPSYFYFERNPSGDILFGTIIEALYFIVYKKDPERKRKLLERLKDDCYFLMDVCNEPINRDSNFKRRSDLDRSPIISQRIPELINELGLLESKGILLEDTKIILIKKNIYQLLEQPLKDAGFNVINKDKVNFPGYHGDKDTIKDIRKLLKIR